MCTWQYNGHNCSIVFVIKERASLQQPLVTRRGFSLCIYKELSFLLMLYVQLEGFLAASVTMLRMLNITTCLHFASSVARLERNNTKIFNFFCRRSMVKMLMFSGINELIAFSRRMKRKIGACIFQLVKFNDL